MDIEWSDCGHESYAEKMAVGSRIASDLIWEGQEMGRSIGGVIVMTEDTTRKAAASFVRDVTTDPDKAAILVARPLP